MGPPSRQPPASGFESPGASPGWSPGHPGVRSPNAGTRSPTRILGPHRCRPLCGKGVPPPSRGPPPAGVAARGHLGPRGGGPVRDSIPGSGSRPPEPRAAPGVPAQARRRLPANGTRAGLRCRLRPRAGRGSGGPAGGGGEARPRASPPAAGHRPAAAGMAGPGSRGAGALPGPSGAGLGREVHQSRRPRLLAGSRTYRNRHGDGPAAQVATTRRSHSTGPTLRAGGRFGGGPDANVVSQKLSSRRCCRPSTPAAP